MIEELIQRLDKLKEAVDFSGKKKKIEILENEVNQPHFWDDQAKAREVTKKLASLKKEVGEIESLAETLTILKEIPEEKELKQAQKTLAKLELTSYLGGEFDEKNALMAIHAGQGGTEAMDWASMLLRMYLRFGEKRGWIIRVLETTAGEEAGIKSVAFKVEGDFAYGYLKGEAGTHRLVRQSPFNADKLRQTSFALVEVLPELEEVDLPEIVIKEEDLDWQFFRSSSQGGQNVQKVSTAVRVTHKPTGIVVSAQAERFQEQNRKNALSLLRAKLWLLEKNKSAAIKKDLKGQYRPASWGNQIRSYVLHPYKMVKDLRTEVESKNPEAVLNGELDEFIEAELKTTCS